jgi:AcrR family transcriptional regulator
MAATVATRVPAQDRREQILNVATALFARHGFEGTTTRQIAEVARVNEAIIFRHFPTKEDLYWAIIRRKCNHEGRTRMIEERIALGGSDLEIFSSIAEQMLSRTRTDENITRLLLFTALERHELSQEFFQSFLAQQYELLAGYIRRRVAEGAFRDIDPALAARGFLGMVIYHYLIQELFGGKRHGSYDPAVAGRTMAELWLRGVVADVASMQTNGLHSNGKNGKRDAKTSRHRNSS